MITIAIKRYDIYKQAIVSNIIQDFKWKPRTRTEPETSGSIVFTQFVVCITAHTLCKYDLTQNTSFNLRNKQLSGPKWPEKIKK